jgi:hypothetical protein
MAKQKFLHNHLKCSIFSAVEASAVDHTTLIHNEEESFALAPVEATAIKVHYSKLTLYSC